MIALLFVGGCIFLLTGSWDTSETEAAKGCCGGGTTLVAETTNGCCGGTNKVSDSDTYNCNCLDTGNEDADCGDCYVDPDNADSECSGANTQSCATACNDDFCGEGKSWCNSTDFETYCPNDGVTEEHGCEGSGDTCSKRTELDDPDPDEE